MATRKPKPIALLNEKTMTFKINKSSFKKKFDDGTPITSFEIIRIGDKMYLERSGKDKKGNCHLWRARVRITSDGQIVFQQGTNAVGCIGDKCSSCRFADPDGRSCKCNVAGGHCNHIILSMQVADFGVFLRR